MDTPLHERLAAGLATGAVMGLLGAALMIGLTVTMRRPAPNTPLLVDLQPPPPEPREKPVHPRARTRAARKAPAPANLKRRPTDIVRPPPLVIPPPIPPVIVAAPVPGPGAAASAGASDRPGPGTGAGGEGNGRGGGGEGDGDFTPPRHIKGSLNYADLPAPLRATGPSGAVMVRYRVGVNGRAGECMVERSSGNAALDAATCDLIERKFRFKPSLDASGRPVGSIITDETHTWILDREESDRR